jgi:hypothetical protein
MTILMAKKNKKKKKSGLEEWSHQIKASDIKQRDRRSCDVTLFFLFVDVPGTAAHLEA